MFQIDLSKKFPNLPGAPIVEAVLHWKAADSKELKQDELEQQLRESFDGYEIAQQHNFETALSESPAGMEVRHSRAWEGFRLEKKEGDKPAFVCQFKRDGVVVSRLAPYRGWQEFLPEAMRFWGKFVELCNPREIASLSTRYISQIPIKTVSEVNSFIERVPHPLAEIGISTEAFFHQDAANLDNLPYTINMVRAVPPAQQPGVSGKSLIIDISVSTTDSIGDFGLLENKLSEIRYIKNQAFFTLMKNAKENFGEERNSL